MTFADWWASITESERRLLGKGYAEYIWNTAQAQVRPAKIEIKTDPRQLDLFEK